METKLTSLGSVMLGEKFVFRTTDVLGPRSRKTSFEGQVLTVVGFRAARYVNRIVLKAPDGEELLFPVDVVEKALSLRPDQRTQ